MNCSSRKSSVLFKQYFD